MRWHWTLALVVVQVLVGCDNPPPAGRACEVDRNCLAGEWCVERVCLPAGDSGAGGGMGGGTDAGTGGGGGTVMCSPLCEDSYECRAPGDGGATGECELAFERLEVLAPDGGTFGPDASVPVVARLVRKAGFSAAAPSFVELALDGMALSGRVTGDGGYAGQVSTLGLTEGAHTVTVLAVFADAGLSGTGAFTVDATGPTLTFISPTRPIGSGDYQRDDVWQAAVQASESVSVAALEVGGATMDPTPCDGGVQCEDGGECTCFAMDLSQPELKGLTGNFGITMSAMDVYGNQATGDGGTVAVTRVRWVTQVGGGNMRVAPAVGPDGTVYVGTNDINFTAGTLQALSHLTGADAGSTTLWGAINAVAVSPAATHVNSDGSVTGPVVYAVANGMGTSAAKGRLLGRSSILSGSVSTVDVPTPCEGLGTNKVWSGLALTKTTGSRVAAIATTASALSVPARVLKWDSVDGCTFLPLDQTTSSLGSPLEPSPVGTTVETAVSPLILNGVANFVTRQPVTGIPNMGLLVRRVSGLTGSMMNLESTVATLETSDQAVSLGMARFQSTELLTSSTLTGRQIYRVLASFVTRDQPLSGVDYGLPVVANIGLAFIGAGERLVRFNPGAASSAVELANAPGATMLVSPVLLEPAGGRTAEGFTVTNDGRLVCFDASSSGVATSTWVAALPSSTGSPVVVTHPGFDCNRRPGAATSTTGLLYVAARDGRVYSIIVDSPRLLDDVGAWPKYQRTMGNAGNDDTNFFPTNWGTCPN